MGKKNKLKKIQKNRQKMFLKKKLNFPKNHLNNNEDKVKDKNGNKNRDKKRMKRLKKFKKKNQLKKQEEEYYPDLYDIENIIMDEKELDNLPHDKFSTYKLPSTLKDNEEYISELIKESDIILSLLDARDIYHTINSKEEEIVKNDNNKLLIYIITKSDLVSNNYLEKIKTYLSSLTNNKIPVIITSSLIREKIQYLLEQLITQLNFFKNGNSKGPIKIGIIGQPNVGKNSLIQSLELIVNSNCDDKYIYFDDAKKFCINSLPGTIYSADDSDSFLISKQYKNVNEIPNPIKLINKLFDVINNNKLKEIYGLTKTPENLDDFLNLFAHKYEFENVNLAAYQILKDIVNGKIFYEVEQNNKNEIFAIGE